MVVSNNCIEPIVFPLDTTSENIVIYGQLTDADEPQYVYIQKSSVDQNLPAPIRGAFVFLVDNQNNRYRYTEDKAGRYKLNNLTHGTPGATYFIEVTINNSIYRSEKERMPTTIGSDSVSYTISKETYESADFARLVHRLDVFSKSKLPSETDYFLRWDTNEVYYFQMTNFPDIFNTPAPDCYASDRVDPQRITLLNGSSVTGKSVEQLVAQREIDFTFLDRHYIIVRQLSTTRDSYEYWSKVKALLANTGSPFDIPPAIVQGNIENTDNPNETVLGYFETCRVTTDQFFLVPGYIPYYIEPYCTYDFQKPYERYPAPCVDCLALPNGTYTKPAGF